MSINIVEASDLVEVENAPPSVVSLNIPESDGYRMESITIIADGKDDDHGESALEAIFEYKGPIGDWTGSDDTGTYFGSPTYYNGHWQIDFEPPSDAEVGDYSFRVAFSDGIDTTTYMEKTDAYELLNQPPEVEITSPDSGTQSSTTIKFTIDVNDDKDTDFTYEWDFDDGGSSTEESPTHEFDPGDSYDVTVKVTDSDGDSTEEEITITIPSDGGGDGTSSGEEGGDDMMMFLLLLIIIIVVVVLLVVFLLTKKKKKPEEGLPPAAPAMAPGPPMAGAPPLAGAGPPGEVPAAAPAAAVPAAVPAAAAPKAGAKAGQQIKCPKCGTAFTVESTERPITIECPNCHAKGKLN
jgi:PKD repeat protein